MSAIQEDEAGESPWVQGQPGLHNEILSQRIILLWILKYIYCLFVCLKLWYVKISYCNFGLISPYICFAVMWIHRNEWLGFFKLL